MACSLVNTAADLWLHHGRKFTERTSPAQHIKSSVHCSCSGAAIQYWSNIARFTVISFDVNLMLHEQTQFRLATWQHPLIPKVHSAFHNFGVGKMTTAVCHWSENGRLQIRVLLRHLWRVENETLWLIKSIAAHNNNASLTQKLASKTCQLRVH